MFVEIRKNTFLGDEACLSDVENLKKNGINRVVIVADDVQPKAIDGISMFWVPLRSDRMNPSHIKDLACHLPKYMVSNGDKVLIVSKLGYSRAAYIVARMICELEGKTIYDIFMEMQPKIEGFDIGLAYL